MSANLENTPLRPSGSRLDLINATVAAISRHGLSDLTSAKIAGMAGPFRRNWRRRLMIP
jgi:hypothetical protein